MKMILSSAAMAGSLLAVSIPAFAWLIGMTLAAHAGGSVLRVGAAQGLPGCTVFIMPNGHQWRAMKHDISAGGKCPADFLSGHAIGRNQVKLSNGATCTYDDTGNGTCE